MGSYSTGSYSEVRTSRPSIDLDSVNDVATATTPFSINPPKRAASRPALRHLTTISRAQTAASDVRVDDVFQERELEGISLIVSITKDETREMLAYLEDKYAMSSEEFLRRWERGEMPDNFETNYWSILVK